MTYLFRINRVEPHASIDEAPFHVFIKCWTYVEPEPPGGEQTIML